MIGVVVLYALAALSFREARLGDRGRVAATWYLASGVLLLVALLASHAFHEALLHSPGRHWR